MTIKDHHIEEADDFIYVGSLVRSKEDSTIDWVMKNTTADKT